MESKIDKQCLEKVVSHLVSRREYLRLVDPANFWEVLTPESVVDELPLYTREMWEYLRCTVGEWYDIRVPSHRKSEWGPPIEAPPDVNVEMCLDQRTARRLRTDIQASKYDPHAREGRLTVFGGYGVRIPKEFEREADGIAFLARQVDHLPDLDHYLIVLTYREGNDMHYVRFQPELVHSSAFLAAGAIVVGNVSIAEEASVWFNAVLRGDCEAIQIGRRSNIQDGCVLHADPGFPCIVGDGVTVGHAAVLHGARIADNVLIGMRSVVMNGAQIGENSLIAVGAVVTEGTVVPPGSLVMGMPGKIKRPLTEQELAHIRFAAEHYVENAKRYAGIAMERGG